VSVDIVTVLVVGSFKGHQGEGGLQISSLLGLYASISICDNKGRLQKNIFQHSFQKVLYDMGTV